MPVRRNYDPKFKKMINEILTEKDRPKGRSDTNRWLYFLTADALKNVKYRAIFLLPIAFIVVMCMINLGLSGLFGIQKLPYLVEIYIGSSILLLMAVFRLMYVDSR